MPSASSTQTPSPNASAATMRLRSSDGTRLNGADSCTDASIDAMATVARTADGRCHRTSGMTQWCSDIRTQTASTTVPKSTTVRRPGYRSNAAVWVASCPRICVIYGFSQPGQREYRLRVEPDRRSGGEGDPNTHSLPAMRGGKASSEAESRWQPQQQPD